MGNTQTKFSCRRIFEITISVVVSFLLFVHSYTEKVTLITVKSFNDQARLRRTLLDGVIGEIILDHACLR